MSIDYKYKYNKYKHKYLIHNGGSIQGDYYKENNYNRQYRVFKTYENKYISYYEAIPTEINKNDFTTNLKKPDPKKILLIDNVETFDFFTNKYGQICKDLETSYIQWNRVANDYKGFYLNSSNTDLFIQKHEYVNYKVYRLNSWWVEEYNVNGVMIFDK